MIPWCIKTYRRSLRHLASLSPSTFLLFGVTSWTLSLVQSATMLGKEVFM